MAFEEPNPLRFTVIPRSAITMVAIRRFKPRSGGSAVLRKLERQRTADPPRKMRARNDSFRFGQFFNLISRRDADYVVKIISPSRRRCEFFSPHRVETVQPIRRPDAEYDPEPCHRCDAQAHLRSSGRFASSLLLSFHVS